MKTVLIVSPHFPPINAPDHQRVRMALPYFKQFGWQATVLAVELDCVEGVRDPLLSQTVPDGTPVVRTGALPVRWMRLVGVGSLAYRAFGSLRRAGEQLLRRRQFDLVFFSTTVFPIMALGPRWRRRHGVPYVLDFQDPWLSDYYGHNPIKRPPGGVLKYGFSQWLAKRLEPIAVRAAGQIVCVSKTYVETFQHRYPDVPLKKFTILPFGAPELDFAALPDLQVSQSVFDPRDGRRHWAYIGRGGEDMAFAVRAFFTALRQRLDENAELATRLHIHFVGTDYAPKQRARKTIEPIAREYGVDKIVSEQTDRLPYFTALRCLSDAHALFVPGSDDPGYTASKIYPYILARKPLLAVFHRQSSVVEVIRSTRAGTVVTFESGDSHDAVASRILKSGWLQDNSLPAAPGFLPATDWDAFEPYTAKEMTRRLCRVFDRVV